MAKIGGDPSGRGVTRAVMILGCAMLSALILPGVAAAATVCRLPATFSLTVEERSLLDGGGIGLVVTGSPAPTSGLRGGDVIRQANGRRTERCEDLESAAADALARGLLLLVAAERDGRVAAVALGGPAVAIAVAEPTAAPSPGRASDVVASAPRGPIASSPVPTVVSTPVVFRETTLPARADASAELASKAVAAAAVLGTVEEAARFTVPLHVYERRLDEATNAIAALHIEGDRSAAVRDVIAEVVAYHETARDIRRYKAAELEHARVDQRGAGALSLPYFSDSQVPRWIERYPFLSESLQQAPRTTHMLLPGEMAGRWNPDQAVELLWDHAAKASARLGAWGTGK